MVVLRNPRPHGVEGSSETPYLIKRIAAVAGQPVPPDVPGRTVPEGQVVVLGDNPAQSLDSRHLGPIPLTHVIARVYRRMTR
ncbi:hypothetical protein D5H75_16135 [Bailinhaonella thermotolerans]|uniref:Peptidase S26 domain-containing protein n=1 Tax=Bailinhaonella thermotolerans TaxID=1070861 RepID=A0A3A4B4F9_9ACTN|nr:hypothetical protein D5H75_16135 [Bailinhaonella thermotolerans]